MPKAAKTTATRKAARKTATKAGPTLLGRPREYNILVSERMFSSATVSPTANGVAAYTVTTSGLAKAVSKAATYAATAWGRVPTPNDKVKLYVAVTDDSGRISSSYIVNRKILPVRERTQFQLDNGLMYANDIVSLKAPFGSTVRKPRTKMSVVVSRTRVKKTTKKKTTKKAKSASSDRADTIKRMKSSAAARKKAVAKAAAAKAAAHKRLQSGNAFKKMVAARKKK